jgi:hypothetical protein
VTKKDKTTNVAPFLKVLLTKDETAIEVKDSVLEQSVGKSFGSRRLRRYAKKLKLTFDSSVTVQARD